MKLTLTTAALLLSLLTLVPAVAAQKKTCSCKAPDADGCDARVECPLGCTALCGSNDACYAACGNVEVDKVRARITLKVENGDGKEISASLSKHSGRRIKFTPKQADALYSFELKNDPVRKALKFLARRGKVTVDGRDFEMLEEIRRKLSKGDKVSVNFTDVPVRGAVGDLSYLSGLPFSVKSGNAEELLSISLENVSLPQIVQRISAQTGVKIKQAGRRASIKKNKQAGRRASIK